MIYHFLYRVTSSTGLYYVGRHTTTNLNDGYLGSGRWPKSIKKKEELVREIIGFFENEEKLKEAETKLLSEVISDPKNMNFSNNSSGFSFGDLNPAKSERERARRSNDVWTKTDAGKEFLRKNSHQFRTVEFREKQRQRSLEQLTAGMHNFQKPVSIAKKIEAAIDRLSTTNPMHESQNRNAASLRAKAQIDNGTHNFLRAEVREKNRQITSKMMLDNNPMKRPEIVAKFKNPKPIIRCPHCNKNGAGPSMYRFHFGNCKAFLALEADGNIQNNTSRNDRY